MSSSGSNRFGGCPSLVSDLEGFGGTATKNFSIDHCSIRLKVYPTYKEFGQLRWGADGRSIPERGPWDNPRRFARYLHVCTTIIYGGGDGKT